MKGVAPSRWQSWRSRSERSCGSCTGTRAPRKRLHGGPRLVGGQLQGMRRPGELLAPPAKLLVQHLALQPLPLPGGVVGVLDGQLGEGRRAGPAEKAS